MNYEATSTQGPTGQWSWTIKEDGTEIAGGAGYDTKDDAEEDMLTELAEYKNRS